MAPWAPKTYQQTIRERRGGLESTGPNRRQYCDGKWRETRQRVLIRDPICKQCNRNPSTRADHIVPVSRGGSDSMENLQGMCEPCHNAKIGTERGGFQERWAWNK